MRISKADAVAVLHFCGYKGMGSKTDAELSLKVSVVPEIFDEKDKPDEAMAALIAGISAAVKAGESFEVYSPEPEKVAAPVVAETAQDVVETVVETGAETGEEAAAAVPDGKKRIRRSKEQIAADDATKALEKAAKKAARDAKKVAAAAEKPARAKRQKTARNVDDVRARRGKDGSAFLAGKLLKTIGLEGGITAAKLEQYRVSRGVANKSQDRWYLTTAWNAICGYLGEFPEKPVETPDVK